MVRDSTNFLAFLGYNKSNASPVLGSVFDYLFMNKVQIVHD